MKEQKSNPMVRIWEIAKPEHGRLLMSVVLAALGVASGIVPFVSAAKIISGMISGNREWSYYLVFVAAAFVGFAFKSLFYAMGLSVSHKATFSLLGEIRNKTVIMIAHRLKTIRNADRIVVLNGGTICSGTHEELLRSSDKYSSFIKLREEAARWKMQTA